MTDWMIDTLIATSGLVLLVLLIRDPIRRRFGASVAYGLWLLPALRMVMPPITQTVERFVPAAASAQASPLYLPMITPAQPPSLVEQLGGWSTILIAIWAVGAAVMLVHGTLTYRRQRSRVIASGVQLARLGRIRIVSSEAVRGPMAFGIVDPVIVLPHDFEHRFDERQRRLTLDHELAHHRSGDLVANLIAYVLLCLQWFNPLAWAAHTAFRFDQEAACDARVLDMVDGPDRAAYGQAITKAASGRTLLFAGALDRPHTLSRRLQSMLISSNPRARLIGRAMILAGAAVAMPLTATWATNYVDVVATVPPTPPAPPTSASAPDAPLPPLPPQAAMAPLPPLPPVPPGQRRADSGDSDVNFGNGISFVGDDTVRISGTTKRWSELTTSERAAIRAETAKAQQQLDREMARLPEQMANARREMEKFRNGEFQREMAKARVEIRQALAEIDSNAAAIRAAGQNPEALKAQVRDSLREVETMDIDKTVRESLASINPDKIAASLREAQASLAQIDAKLDQLDRP